MIKILVATTNTKRMQGKLTQNEGLPPKGWTKDSEECKHQKDEAMSMIVTKLIKKDRPQPNSKGNTDFNRPFTDKTSITSTELQRKDRPQSPLYQLNQYGLNRTPKERPTATALSRTKRVWPQPNSKEKT